MIQTDAVSGQPQIVYLDCKRVLRARTFQVHHVLAQPGTLAIRLWLVSSLLTLFEKLGW